MTDVEEEKTAQLFEEKHIEPRLADYENDSYNAKTTVVGSCRYLEICSRYSKVLFTY